MDEASFWDILFPPPEPLPHPSFFSVFLLVSGPTHWVSGKVAPLLPTVFPASGSCYSFGPWLSSYSLCSVQFPVICSTSLLQGRRCD